MAGMVCPVWIGYLLASPVRKLFENPYNILSPYLEEGMKVLDIGCAMGFYSLPLAQMVGFNGKVICVDMQKKMIKSLEKRARKTGLSNRIETRVCGQNSLGLDELTEEIDFALAASVVHEVPDAPTFFSEIRESIKQKGRLLVLEPKYHVSEKNFNISVSIAEQNGFRVIKSSPIGRSRSVLLERI